MAFKKIPLTIDTMIRNPVPVEGINQEDNVELNIVVTENKTPKDLSSQTIKVYVRRIDGTLVEQTDQITPTNARKGEVTVKLKNSAFNKEGYALFQLDVSDSIGRITSSYATFKIGKGLVSGEAIANTNEIEALKKVEEYIKKANQELETFKQTVTEINENEATRQENEVVRVREEASRNKAEAIRVQQEATRKEKENERVQAETKRIADEEVRRENEVLRGSEELERKQAEELRKEKELLRIADEKNRKVAESKRIEAESVRVEAEKLRVAAETERVEAESLRVTAEEERVAAETKREEEFNKFESKINANTKELKNARTATTGEKFNSLDERIDCEVERLSKKIEVSFLQQEDKESHTIENTVEGMTTDMVVKGRTLINMVKLGSVSNVIGIAYDTLAIYSYMYNLKNDTDYTIIFEIENKTDENQVRISLNDGKRGHGINVKNGFNVVKIRSESEKNNKLMFYYGSEYPGNGTVKNVILLEGDWTNKPITQYFDGIKSFGQQEDKISILSHGKNLFNHDELTNGEIVTFNNKRCFKYKDDATNFSLPVNGELGKQYTLSIKIYRDEDKKDKSCNVQFVYSDGTKDSKTFINGALVNYITTLGKRLIKIKGNFNYGYNCYIDLECTQLEEGTQSTQYEPYQSDKKDILLQNLGFDEGLRGLNNSIYDELNDINHVAIKKVGKYTFTGNEEIAPFRLTNEENEIAFKFNSLNLGFNKNSAYKNAISNMFKVSSSVYIGDSYEGIALNQNGRVYIRIFKNKLSTPDIQGFKTWLKTNSITIYYELAEPVETPLDENINLKTFGEKTYVSFENAISGTSSFKAPVDTKATIARLNRENGALEEENKTLRQDFESTTLSLTDSDLELVKQNVDIDFRLMEVEFALDIPQATLSSNINFKKKGEVKSMARTPYAMMKIVILSGDYDREDYIHKVGKYYERGRMTKEEYDELMSLMTADEVIGG